MYTLNEQQVNCPYCGEMISLLVDCSVVDQDYVEDCEVCCRPMVVTVHVVEENVYISVGQEND